MTEEEKQKRIKVREFLKQNPISSPDDLNTFFKDMMKVMIEEFYQGELEEELGYPKIAISWKNNWPRLSTYFKYPQEIRTLIYTTNTIEGYNRQLRKVTKNKSVFPTDDSLLKMLYLATQDITKKWTSRQRDLGQMISQFQIYFEGRI
ncbi:transposase [uncultured Cetobacterium sp.]|uniref:transposase n=1 Tax=uncultured Cetobacterium sp. TaxID=527638 RepID=UPI0025E8C9C5|nr:transposase [uncultured Cetobacterium sp.]